MALGAPFQQLLNKHLCVVHHIHALRAALASSGGPLVLCGRPFRGLRSRLAPRSHATIRRFATSGTVNEPKVVISALETACVKLPVSRVGKWGAMTATPYGAGYAIGRRLCLTERVMPNGASLAPFAAESQCYACQTRSVRHNSLPYDTATPVPTSTTSQQQPADSKQPGSPRWQAAAPPPSTKCIRWGEKWVAGIDPKHVFDPNVNISRRER